MGGIGAFLVIANLCSVFDPNYHNAGAGILIGLILIGTDKKLMDALGDLVRAARDLAKTLKRY